METTFIYALCEPSGEIRYIGKSDDPNRRLCSHTTSKTRSTSRLSQWVRSLLSKGFKPILKVLDTVSQAEWQAVEAAYIAFYLEEGCRLVNATPGGEGMPSGKDHPLFGKPKPPEQRAKMSASQKGRKKPIEQIAKMVATKTRNNSWRNRKPASNETRAKISASKKGKPCPLWQRAWLSLINKGKTPSAEARAKISAANKGRKLSIEIRTKMSLAKMGIKLPPEHVRSLCIAQAKRREREWTEKCLSEMWN